MSEIRIQSGTVKRAMVTYEDIRIFPSLADYHTILPRPTNGGSTLVSISLGYFLRGIDDAPITAHDNSFADPDLERT
jgi:hypothetical protein